MLWPKGDNLRKNYKINKIIKVEKLWRGNEGKEEISKSKRLKKIYCKGNYRLPNVQ